MIEGVISGCSLDASSLECLRAAIDTIVTLGEATSSRVRRTDGGRWPVVSS